MKNQDTQIKVLILITVLSLSLLLANAIWGRVEETLNITSVFVSLRVFTAIFAVSILFIKVTLRLIIKFLERHE